MPTELTIEIEDGLVGGSAKQLHDETWTLVIHGCKFKEVIRNQHREDLLAQAKIQANSIEAHKERAPAGETRDSIVDAIIDRVAFERMGRILNRLREGGLLSEVEGVKSSIEAVLGEELDQDKLMGKDVNRVMAAILDGKNLDKVVLDVAKEYSVLDVIKQVTNLVVETRD